MVAAVLRYRFVFMYGAALAALMFLLHRLELSFMFLDGNVEICTGLIAMLFTGLGIWLAFKLRKPKIETVTIEKEVYLPALPGFKVNEQEATALELSQRELDVLQLMSAGLSNQEIADRLFVSLNTVKTHASAIFSKLGVKRRIQAVETAKRLNIISSVEQ